MRWTGAIELFHQSQLTLMDYKLSNVDDKHRPCFTSISSKGLANGYIGYFVRRIAFLIRIRSKKLRDVVGLRTEFFQFDTCGCQITRAPYQKEAQICNYLFFVIFFADIMLLLVLKHFISFVTCYFRNCNRIL